MSSLKQKRNIFSKSPDFYFEFCNLCVLNSSRSLDSVKIEMLKCVTIQIRQNVNYNIRVIRKNIYNMHICICLYVILSHMRAHGVRNITNEMGVVPLSGQNKDSANVLSRLGHKNTWSDIRRVILVNIAHVENSDIKRMSINSIQLMNIFNFYC